MNGHHRRMALSAALIATLSVLGTGCAQVPGGRGTNPASTPYKGDEPWKISQNGDSSVIAMSPHGTSHECR